MLTLKEIVSIISDVESDLYEFHVDCIQCERLQGQLPGEPIWPEPCQDTTHTWYVQAKLFREDTVTGVYGYGYGTKNIISANATEGEIVKRAFVCARDYAEHEVREGFKYKGRRVLGPHIPIQLLWEISNRVDRRAE